MANTDRDNEVPMWARKTRALREAAREHTRARNETTTCREIPDANTNPEETFALEEIPAIFSGRVIQGPDGQEYLLLIVTDISAQKRIEQQLRDSSALLENRSREVEAELSLAARIHQSLAPRSLVWNNVAVEGYYSPARTIGGDLGVVLRRGDSSSKRVRGSTGRLRRGGLRI